MPIPHATADYGNPLVSAARNLLFKTASYLNADERVQLEKACAYAFHAHDGQTRQSGEPYITHPIAVATELAKWRMDLQTLSAGLMHDVLEDTGVEKAEMAAVFGDVITEMVDGLSKLEKLEYNSKEEHQAESFRKLILAMTKDVRVIIVKLADRLHNMRTLDSMRLEKRRRIAQETLEIHAAIANRIGLNHVYLELQDLAFANLHPNRYKVLQNAMTAFRRERRDVIGKVLRNFSLCLVGANIEAQIQGREKNLYGIHRKMESKRVKFADVLDIYGFRVVVNDIPACYAALGALHGLYQPKPGRIKDYIAIPKSNGYQSLHTTLTGPYGLPIEVQIRTRAMHAVAEGGIASHCAYKAGASHEDENTVRTNQWLQSILDLQASSADAIEFLEHVKVDLFPNEVYIFTPKGKILTLPRGATPIDFAYTVHTDIGNRCVAARVNNVLVPLRTKLKNGDSVEIITSASAAPNPAWLSFAVSSRARSAIRNYVKNMNRHDAVALGESLLQKALANLLPENVLFSEELKDKYLTALDNAQTRFEDVLFNVGTGQTQPVSVAMQIAALAGEHFGDEIKLSPIDVNGHETGRVHLGKCCCPLPGDEVRAVMQRESGLTIHRDTCPLLLKTDPDQQLDADWDSLSDQDRRYDAAVLVSSQDAHALLAAMAQAISSAGGNITSVDTPSKLQAGTEGFIQFRFNLTVKNLSQLQHIINNLNAIPQVRNVSRILE